MRAHYDHPPGPQVPAENYVSYKKMKKALKGGVSDEELQVRLACADRLEPWTCSST